MTRVSQLELYNDKDIITQICMMKQEVETGTYSEVRVISTGGNYVFEFEDQQGNVQTFTVPAKQISGVTSSQSGSTVTMRITYTDSSYTDVSWTAGGDVTTNTAQNITAVKTFTVSPIIPDTPSGTHAAVNVSYVESTVPGVNNIVHKSGNETIAGVKRFVPTANAVEIGNGRLSRVTLNYDNNGTNEMIGLVGMRYATATSQVMALEGYCPKADPTDPTEQSHGGFLQLVCDQTGTVKLQVFGIRQSDGSPISKTLATFDGTTWS